MEDKNVPNHIWHEYVDYPAGVSPAEIMKEYKAIITECMESERQQGTPYGFGDGNGPSDSWMVKRTFACAFLGASMNAKERIAYMELHKQLNPDFRNSEHHLVVPKTVAEKDARRALKLLKLVGDPGDDFHVTYEAQPGKKKLMTEKPKQP